MSQPVTARSGSLSERRGRLTAALTSLFTLVSTSLRGTVGSSIVTTAGTNLLIMLVTLGSGVILARALGPDGRGELATAMLWPPLIAGVGSLGLTEAVAYFTARRGPTMPNLLGTSLILAAAQSIVLVGIGIVVVPLMVQSAPEEVQRAAFLFLIVIPFYPVTGYPLALLQGRLRLGLYNAIRFSVHPIWALGIFGFWLTHQLTLNNAIVLFLVASAAPLVLVLAVASRFPASAWGFDRGLARALLAYGMKLHLGNLTVLAAAQAPVAILALSRPSSDVGLYVAAGTVTAAVNLIPTAVSTVLLPLVAQRDLETRRQMVRRLLRLGLPLSLFLLPPAVAILPLAIPIALGAAFQDAEGVALLLVIAFFIKGWGTILATAYRALERPLQSSFGDIVSALVLVGGLYALTPAYGAGGAAVAGIVSAAVGLAFLLTYGLTRLGI